MKKWVSVLLCFVLILPVLAACGGNGIPEGYEQEGEYLFAEDPAEGAFYNYCPSILQEDENTRHVYYCVNERMNVVVDCVAYRKGIKVNGNWYYSPKQYVLSPTAGTWDGEHVCDPDVVKGEFSYNGETYSYLMAFLGCARTDTEVNEVGLAVAKQPEGPWVKCDAVNPVIDYEYDESRPEAFQWGYGQPSLVSVDQKGKVLLSYTCGPGGDDHVELGRWDLSDLNEPINEFRARVPITGITQFNSSAPTSCITNANFAYDETSKRLYMICDALPLDTENTPDFITQALYVGYMEDLTGAVNVMGDVLKEYDGRSWTTVGFITPALTGYARNHNGCIVRDVYGRVASSVAIELGYSVCYGINLPGRQNLFSYRIKDLEMQLPT